MTYEDWGKFFYGVRLMGFESLFVAQISIMCGFLIFAWIPDRFVGSILGLVSSSCLIGALPNTYIGLDQELKEM